jgi:hypothetical protein
MQAVAFFGPRALRLLMTKAWVAALLALGAFGLIGTAGVQASCARAPSLQEQLAASPLVFVGTVAFTSDNDRVARVKVESIWKGPDLPAYVDVHGSPVSGWFAFSSVDRTFRTGERDIFVLFSDRQPLQDDSCSATQPYTAEVAAFAPSNAQQPAPPTASDQIQNVVSEYWLPIGIAAIVIALAALIGLRRLRSVRK